MTRIYYEISEKLFKFDGNILSFKKTGLPRYDKIFKKMTGSLAVLCIKTASAFQLRLQIHIEGESNRVSSEKCAKRNLYSEV
jgi:hypothetical protein